MSRFIDHHTLGCEVITLFREANYEITIVSPFIKLHKNIRRELEKIDPYSISSLPPKVYN